MTAYLIMAWTSFGRPSNFGLLNSHSRYSDCWWYEPTMYTLRTSAMPFSLSAVGLLNSTASNTPRSSAGTISGPGSAITVAPMPS